MEEKEELILRILKGRFTPKAYLLTHRVDSGFHLIDPDTGRDVYKYGKAGRATGAVVIPVADSRLGKHTLIFFQQHTRSELMTWNPVTGEVKSRKTEGMTYNSAPVQIPGTRSVVFATSNRIEVWNTDGIPKPEKSYPSNLDFNMGLLLAIPGMGLGLVPTSRGLLAFYPRLSSSLYLLKPNSGAIARSYISHGNIKQVLPLSSELLLINFGKGFSVLNFKNRQASFRPFERKIKKILQWSDGSLLILGDSTPTTLQLVNLDGVPYLTTELENAIDMTILPGSRVAVSGVGPSRDNHATWVLRVTGDGFHRENVINRKLTELETVSSLPFSYEERVLKCVLRTLMRFHLPSVLTGLAEDFIFP